MRYRTQPFGYTMEYGQIVCDKTEARIVVNIYMEYIAGAKLDQLADKLSKQKVEYIAGKYEWDKNRIKRLLEDKRYMGDHIYPQIIDKATFKEVNSIRERRSYWMKTCKITSRNKNMIQSVYCAKCGGKLKHRTDNRLKTGMIWFCVSTQCKKTFRISIESLEREIKNILNSLIENPARIELQENETAEVSLEIKCVENDIERKLGNIDFNKDEIQNLILACASMKYEKNTGKNYISERIKADLERTSPLLLYSPELFERIVSKVILDDESISIMLQNNQILNKEQKDGTNDDSP